MSRSIRDLRELICLSRFGFRSDETEIDNPVTESSSNNILFFFDPSILNNWLEITSSRLEKLRTLSTNTFINLIHFWLKQFDYEHKQSLFQMELELFVEHLLLAFTPNDINSIQIDQFARQILHDLVRQFASSSLENDYEFLLLIDIFNRCKRDDQYRTLLANLPNQLTSNINNHLHLQWMLAIRAFGLVAICIAAVDFYEKIQKTLEQKGSIAELYSSPIDEQSPIINPADQSRNRILTALRKDHVHVIDYFIKMNQLTGESLDNQNRNILFHALPIGNTSMIEHLLKSQIPKLDINSLAQSGNSLVHLCVTLQRLDLLGLIRKYYPEINLNQRNQQDATPIHLAIIFTDLSMVRYLIESGADWRLLMKNKTCLQISTEFQDKELIEFFSQLN